MGATQGRPQAGDGKRKKANGTSTGGGGGGSKPAPVSGAAGGKPSPPAAHHHHHHTAAGGGHATGGYHPPLSPSPQQQQAHQATPARHSPIPPAPSQQASSAADPQFDENSHPFHAPLDHVREEERPLHELSAVTHFDVATLRKLQIIFTDIAESDVDDGIIDGNELTDAMGLESSCLLARTIFKLFDITHQKKIDFAQWVKTISALSVEASLEEKIKFSFSLYDLNNDGSIDVEELRAMLEAAVLDENVLHLSSQEVKDWCDYTLSQVDRDGNGKVDYEEYRSMVQNSVKFIESFTLDIHELCNSFRFTTKRAGEGKLTAHEVDQRLLWFRARQKQHSGSESSKQSSAHEDNQSNNGSQHEPHSAGLAAPNPAGAHLRPISAGGGGGGSRGRKSAGNSAGKGNRSGERGAGGRRSGHGSAEKKPAANSTPVRAGAGGSGIHKPVVIAPVTSAAAGAATNASISQPLSRGGEYDTPTGSAQRSSAAAAPTVIAIQLTAAQAASAASASGLSVAGSPGGEMINTPVFHDQQPTPSPIAAMSEPPVAAAAASSSMSGTAAADAAATAILAAQPAEPSHQPPPHKLALRTSSSHLQHSAADSPSVVHHRELTLAQEALLRHTSGPAAQHQHHSAHYVAANTPTHILRQGSTVSLTQEQEEEAVYRMKI